MLISALYILCLWAQEKQIRFDNLKIKTFLRRKGKWSCELQDFPLGNNNMSDKINVTH